VTQGGLLIAGRELTVLAKVVVSREKSLKLHPGEDGPEVLVLQFPVEA
jgi:hypothetical protein